MNALAEIRSELRVAFAAVERYFGALREADLYCRSSGGWAPIHDLEHLSLTVGLTARSLSLTDEELDARFGRATRPSRAYEAVKATYLETLRAGFRSPERFVPATVERAPEAGDRARALETWKGAGAALQSAVEAWDETRLDAFFIPHPALGDLTARELLYFTHIHALHHVEVAERRVAAGRLEPGPA